MRILAFESSAKAASVALLTDGALTAEMFQNCGLTHSVTLLSMAEDLLRQTGLKQDNMDAYAVACGPGSFTGVRIGISAVKGLGWASEKPCIGVSTLEAMAQLHIAADGVICPVMDARRSQVYHAAFCVQNGELVCLRPDCAISLDELAEELRAFSGKKILVGDGALLCYNALEAKIDKLSLAPEHLRQQRASGVALAAWQKILAGESGAATALTPNYLRLSQAERERMERNTRE